MYTREEIEAAGLHDFRRFLVEVWHFLRLPAPTPVQFDIAYYLQHGPRRSIIQAFRGVGKSWLTVAFVVWTLLLNPEAKIMVVSASQDLADDFSRFAKTLIHGMPILQHLAPRADQKDSAIAFMVGPATPSKDPSLKSAGITGQITGSRADIIIADDIEIPKNSYTHLLRERLSELVKEFDAVLKPGGRIIYLGTPQVESSIYVKLQNRGYETRIWPAEIPERLDIYGQRLADFVRRKIEAGAKPGDPVDPARFDRADLDERRLSYGHAGYALQFMLDTSPSSAEKHPLRVRDLIIADCDPELAPVKLVWGGDKELVLQDLPSVGLDGDFYVKPAWRSPEMAKYTGTVMAIDPSGKGQDETAYAIVKHLHGLLYVVEVGGFRDGYGERTLEAIASAAIRWGVNDIIIEENFGGGMFNNLLRPVLAKRAAIHDKKPPRIDEEWEGKWSRTQKELRICDTLEPLLRSHRVVVDRRVIEDDLKVAADTERYSFVRQLTRMARQKDALPNEDRVEAVSMACSYFEERMKLDTDKAVERHKAGLLEKELKKYLDHVANFGRKGRPTSPWRRVVKR